MRQPRISTKAPWHSGFDLAAALVHLANLVGVLVCTIATCIATGSWQQLQRLLPIVIGLPLVLSAAFVIGRPRPATLRSALVRSLPFAGLATVVVFCLVMYQVASAEAAGLRKANDKLAVSGLIASEPLLVGSTPADVRAYFTEDAEVGWFEGLALASHEGGKGYWRGISQIVARYTDLVVPWYTKAATHRELTFTWDANTPPHWAVVEGTTFLYGPPRASTPVDGSGLWHRDLGEVWLVHRDFGSWRVSRFWHGVPRGQEKVALSDLLAVAKSLGMKLEENRSLTELGEGQ